MACVPRSGALRHAARWRTPAAAVLVAAAVGAVVGAAVGGFPDLHVYRYGGEAVLDRSGVYDADDPVTGYPFTYPPFAAVLFVPLALLPGWLAAALWTAVSAGCLAASVLLVRQALAPPVSGRLVLLVAAGALALEPVWQNFAFGQVNTVLMVAVLVDLLRPDRRGAGVLLGLAAGVKLTPLVFVVLLVLVGRRGAAGRAVLVFLATVAVGTLAVPGATAYWTDGLLDPSRVGPPELAHNQSVSGALARLLDGPPATVVWLAVAGPLAVAAVLVGAAWWRRGDRVLGACLAAVAMLLASPVSWSHHWVWAVPVALALWARSRVGAAAWTAVFVARPILWPPWGEGREHGWGWAEHLVGNGYLLAALAVVTWAGWQLRRADAAPTGRREPAGLNHPARRRVPEGGR